MQKDNKIVCDFCQKDINGRYYTSQENNSVCICESCIMSAVNYMIFKQREEELDKAILEAKELHDLGEREMEKIRDEIAAQYGDTMERYEGDAVEDEKQRAALLDELYAGQEMEYITGPINPFGDECKRCRRPGTDCDMCVEHHLRYGCGLD